MGLATATQAGDRTVNPAVPSLLRPAASLLLYELGSAQVNSGLVPNPPKLMSVQGESLSPASLGTAAVQPGCM